MEEKYGSIARTILASGAMGGVTNKDFLLAVMESLAPSLEEWTYYKARIDELERDGSIEHMILIFIVYDLLQGLRFGEWPWRLEEHDPPKATKGEMPGDRLP